MTVLKLSKQIQNQEKVLEIAEKKLGDTDYKGVVNKINEIEDKISAVKTEVSMRAFVVVVSFLFFAEYWV